MADIGNKYNINHLPSRFSHSPFFTMQLIPPGYTKSMNLHNSGLNGGFITLNCSRLEIHMQMGFSEGRSYSKQHYMTGLKKDTLYMSQYQYTGLSVNQRVDTLLKPPIHMGHIFSYYSMDGLLEEYL